MVGLEDIYEEIADYRELAPQDQVRRKYLKRLNRLTKRPAILYASCFSVKAEAGYLSYINRQDLSCFMAAAAEIEGNALDLIIHSPGGSVEATEHIVNYLHQKFDDIRVIVPQSALSTATMLCCAADKIAMGDYSSLGPVDPLVSWTIGDDLYTTFAQTVLDEVAIAQRNANRKKNDPRLWMQRLRDYPPGLPVRCKNELQLSRILVEAWLKERMLKNAQQKETTAAAISEWLGNVRSFVTSRRPVGIKEARANGLAVDPLESDEALEANVLAVFYASIAAFETGDCVKIVENHAGKGCMIRARA